jgi:hypothetical protein
MGVVRHVKDPSKQSYLGFNVLIEMENVLRIVPLLVEILTDSALDALLPESCMKSI